MDEHRAYLAVEVQDVERKHVNSDRDVLGLDVLALALGELLEREQLAVDRVPGDGLAVEDKFHGVPLDALQEETRGDQTLYKGRRQRQGNPHPRQLLDEIRVFGAHILRVATEDGEGAVARAVDLTRDKIAIRLQSS